MYSTQITTNLNLNLEYNYPTLDAQGHCQVHDVSSQIILEDKNIVQTGAEIPFHCRGGQYMVKFQRVNPG